MANSDDSGPRWVRGWTVHKETRWRSKFVGVFNTRAEAEEAARKAGKGYEVRFGSYDETQKDLVAGGDFESL